jgi:hypothetical protein
MRNYVINSNYEIFGFVDLLWTGPRDRINPRFLKLDKLVWPSKIERIMDVEILIDDYRSEWLVSRGLGYNDLSFQLPLVHTGGPSSGPAFGFSSDEYLNLVLSWFDAILPPHPQKFRKGEIAEEEWKWAWSREGYQARIDAGDWEWDGSLPLPKINSRKTK